MMTSFLDSQHLGIAQPGATASAMDDRTFRTPLSDPGVLLTLRRITVANSFDTSALKCFP